MSRTIGHLHLPNGEEMNIQQTQKCGVTDYEIQDEEKRAEYERIKAEQQNENE